MSEVLVNKSNFFASFFNSDIFPEVKSNIDYFYQYNREKFADNLVNKTILDIIRDHNILECTEGFISTKLQTQNLSKLEIQDTLEEIYSFKMGDKCDRNTIEHVTKSVRSAVHESYITSALRDFKTDPIGFSNRMKAFRYTSSASDIMPIEKFDQVNIDAEMDRQLNLLFKCRHDFINKSNALGGVPSGSLIQVCGAPATGKSLFMQDKVIEAAKNKIRSHITVLGDLSRLKLICRIYALDTGCSLSHAVLNQKAAFDHVVNTHLNEYLDITVLPSNKLTVYDYKERVTDLDYKFMAIDYDSNFKAVSGNMYDEGDLVYSELTELTMEQGRTVLIGSQPKPMYWESEYIPMLGANESSKKQMHLDMMITLGKFHNPAGTPCGKMAIVKNRDGDLTITNWMRNDAGIFVEVDDLTYAAFKEAKINRTLGDYEIREEMKKSLAALEPRDGALSIQESAQLRDALKDIPNVN